MPHSSKLETSEGQTTQAVDPAAICSPLQVFDSLTVDQMADALGLYACDFWAKHPRDCDVCSNAKEGEMIWVMMAGAYPGSTQEAEYYACSECVAIKHAAACCRFREHLARQQASLSEHVCRSAKFGFDISAKIPPFTHYASIEEPEA